MYVGVCRLQLHLPAAASLKDKRAIVRSLTARLRNQFGVAAAEVDQLDRRQLVGIGLAVVSNDSAHAREVLQKAVRYVEEARLDAELTDVAMDVLASL